MVVSGSHLRIVHMAGVVPYTILFSYTHVAHLHGQEVLQHGLPYATIINTFVDAEDGRNGITILELIYTRCSHIREVSLHVVITQELTPVGRLNALYNLLAIGIDTNKLSHGALCVTLIKLDDSHLLLIGVITHLRGLNNGLIDPVLLNSGGDDPLHGTLRCASLNLAAQNEPAVIVVHTAIIELQIARERLDS